MDKLTEEEIKTALDNAQSQAEKDWITACLLFELKDVTCIYTFKEASKKYPRQILIYYVDSVTDSRWWGKINSLVQIGKRPGTRDECIANHFRFRYRFDIYDSWNDLIQDERLAGTDESFIKILEKASKKYVII